MSTTRFWLALSLCSAVAVLAGALVAVSLKRRLVECGETAARSAENHTREIGELRGYAQSLEQAIESQRAWIARHAGELASAHDALEVVKHQSAESVPAARDTAPLAVDTGPLAPVPAPVSTGSNDRVPERTPDNVAAFDEGSQLIDAAIRAQRWTGADVHALSALLPRLQQKDLLALQQRLAEAIGSWRLAIDLADRDAGR